MNEKTNWGWQFSVFQQKVGEWVEYELSFLNLDLPQSSGWSISSKLEKLLNLLFWVLLGLLLASVGRRLWREFSPYLYSVLTSDNSRASYANTEKELSVSDWLARSLIISQQGNYREACRCLYLATLQYLHNNAIFPHKRSRTDGEYLQLLQLSNLPKQPYETLITTHEQICFGNAEISRENYEQCRQAYQELTQQ